MGIHRGPALAATREEHLDYFGTTVRQALRLPAVGRGGDLVVTRATAADPQAAALLRACSLVGAMSAADLPGQPECLVHRLPA